MKWFDFKLKNRTDVPQVENPELPQMLNEPIVHKEIQLEQSEELPEIKENIFIEYEKPITKPRMEPNENSKNIYNLHTLYVFLEQNFEKKGYEDALMNPDTSSMEEQILSIQNGLSIMLSKVMTYYGSYSKTIDFHIETRKRNGMIETVEELVTYKSTIDEEIRIVRVIEEEFKLGRGISQNLILSYKRGFRNGFAAITYNNVLGKRPE